MLRWRVSSSVLVLLGRQIAGVLGTEVPLCPLMVAHAPSPLSGVVWAGRSSLAHTLLLPLFCFSHVGEIALRGYLPRPCPARREVCKEPEACWPGQRRSWSRRLIRRFLSLALLSLCALVVQDGSASFLRLSGEFLSFGHRWSISRLPRVLLRRSLFCRVLGLFFWLAASSLI